MTERNERKKLYPAPQGQLRTQPQTAHHNHKISIDNKSVLTQMLIQKKTQGDGYNNGNDANDDLHGHFWAAQISSSHSKSLNLFCHFCLLCLSGLQNSGLLVDHIFAWRWQVEVVHGHVSCQYNTLSRRNKPPLPSRNLNSHLEFTS